LPRARAGIERAHGGDVVAASRSRHSRIDLLEARVGIIAFLILGLLAGAIAKRLAPGDDPGGIVVTTLLGVAGALVGGFLASALFGAHPLDDFFDLSTWATAIVGSLILLTAWRMLVRNTDTHHRGVLR
jgi:uncharacterized membrane protein YeaQ/YmgE (transglycosylase-associated protein family)